MMKPPVSLPLRVRGFSLLEVLVAIFITVIGLLGMAGLQSVAGRANLESYQRAQALILLEDMVDRIHANRKSAPDYITATGTYLGTGANATCSTAAVTDCSAWSDLLTGAGEISGTSKVGAMIGARGCVTYDSTSAVGVIAGTGLYTVTVVWQAAEDGFTFTNNACGSGLYGSDSKRRVVTRIFRIASLT